MDGIFCTWRQGCTNRCSLAAGLREKWRGNEEMRRKWRENEEMERDWLSTFPHSLSISSLFLHFLILSPFPPSLSISYIKMRHILLQNVKYGTFVANVTKISTYALWGNNSGSNLLRGSSAICAGLASTSTNKFGEGMFISQILNTRESWSRLLKRPANGLDKKRCWWFWNILHIFPKIHPIWRSRQNCTTPPVWMEFG